MTRRTVLTLLAVVALANSAAAQTSYRLKGTVRDDKGTAVAGARVRAEALQGFRGEQFVGQKEFSTTTNDKGEWNILGLTSGMWVFEATAVGLVPQVIVIPVQYTNRKLVSATGGQLAWDLPMTLLKTDHGLLRQAAEAAVAGKTDESVSLAGGVAEDQDADVVCGGGQVALLGRQHGLAGALFQQVAKRQPNSACAALGRASAALMRGDVINGSKLLWDAREVAPSNQRRALAAAIGDLQQIGALR